MKTTYSTISNMGLNQGTHVSLNYLPLLKRHGQIYALFLDFAKAFDTVPHKRLLKKLQYYGMMTKYITGFLNG